MKGTLYLHSGNKSVIAAILLLLCGLACGGKAVAAESDYLKPFAGPLIQSFNGQTIGTDELITAICEEDGERLFVGSSTRFLIFDGSRWSSAETSRPTKIRSMAANRGRVWVGGVGEAGYYSKSGDGSYVYTSVREQLGNAAEGVFWYTFAFEDGVVFVTDRRVIEISYSDKTPKVWELPNDRRLMAQKVGAEILIGQPTGGTMKLSALSGGVLQAAKTAPTEMSSFVFDFIVESKGHWIFNANRLYSPGSHDKTDVLRHTEIRDFDPQTGITRILFPDTEGVLQRAVVSSGTVLNGQVYLATLNSGLLVVDEQGNLLPAPKGAGISEHCEALCASVAGGVWVGHNRGVSFVQDVSSTRFLLPGAQVRMLSVNAEQLGIATAHNVVQLNSQGAADIPFIAHSLLASGSRLYGTTFSSIQVKDPADAAFRKLVAFPAPPGGLGDLVASAKHPERLLALTTRSIIRYEITTGDVGTTDVPEVPTNILEDAAGTFWFGTVDGGIRTLDADMQRLTVRFPEKTSTRVLMHNGQPFVFSRGRGVFDPAGNTVLGTSSLNEVDGTLDDNGPAWISATPGNALRIGQVEKHGDSLVWVRKNVPGISGLPSIHPFARVGNYLFVAPDEGIIEVDTSKLQNADTSVPPIEELRIRDLNSKTVRTTAFNSRDSKRLEFANSEREFTVTLKKKIWGLLEKPSYESRLLPIEDEWTKHTYGESISRKNLSPGHYTLQIRAIHLGEVGEPAEFLFTRLPPWYASQLGITVLAMGVVFLFFGAVKFRTRQVEQKNRQLEEKIRERTHELAKANAAKSEFLAAMSHEIRNPMNGVVGIVKMLQESNLGVREKYLLSTLHRCSEQLRTTVDDVLDFSKIEAGEITLNRDTFDLADTIRSTIAAIDVSAERAELSSWAGARPIVRGDAAKLAQILTNYLSNALKYGVPPRATVDVFVLDEGDKRCHVTIAVKNTGPDIPPAELSKLFERFQRGEFAKVRRIGGNGLGLSICKRYAEVMGGTVGVTSSGGVTVFQVSLPFDKAEAAVAPDGAALPKSLNARALAIEDEDYNRLVLGNVLHKLGYKVDWAIDGKSAINLAEQNGYDLILTDWMLPDMDGGTLTKRLLEICESPKPPVFAVTAYSTKEKQEECRAAGMAGFVSKPVTIEKLEAALQGWGADRVARLVYEDEDPVTTVSLQQLSKLGPVGNVVPEFVRRLEAEWDGVEQLLPKNPLQAASAAHKIVSATLLVEAQYVSDQLRILEEQLRKGATGSEIEKLRDICREEIEKVAKSLRAAAKRHQRLNDDTNSAG